VRYHLCWGSWHGPHTHDLPLEHIIDLILDVKAQTYPFEAANVRHEHEWRVWQQAKLPAGKVLMPGVVSHATNLVEHPQLVADRILRYAQIVGRENVIAGTDCGLGGRGPCRPRLGQTAQPHRRRPPRLEGSSGLRPVRAPRRGVVSSSQAGWLPRDSYWLDDPATIMAIAREPTSSYESTSSSRQLRVLNITSDIPRELSSNSDPLRQVKRRIALTTSLGQARGDSAAHFVQPPADIG
jgi:hypothetical protein